MKKEWQKTHGGLLDASNHALASFLGFAGGKI
jgi:hypothetical protein